MSIKRYLEASEFLPLERYKQKKTDLKDCIFFTGSPRMHPYDDKKIILIHHPFQSDTIFLEFMLDDISYIEELPNIGNDKGENITFTKIWIKKGCYGVKYEAFEVNIQSGDLYANKNFDRDSN